MARVLIPHHDMVIESDEHLIVFVAHERMIHARRNAVRRRRRIPLMLSQTQT